MRSQFDIFAISTEPFYCLGIDHINPNLSFFNEKSISSVRSLAKNGLALFVLFDNKHSKLSTALCPNGNNTKYKKMRTKIQSQSKEDIKQVFIEFLFSQNFSVIHFSPASSG